MIRSATRRPPTTPHALARERIARRAAHRGGWRAALLTATLLAVVAVGVLVAVFAGSDTGAGEAALWWLTNQSAPTLTAAAPDGPQRGTLSLPVTLEPPARADLTAVTIDGAPPAPGVLSRSDASPAHPTSPLGDWWSVVQAGWESRSSGGPLSTVLDTTKLSDGAHTLQIEAHDRSRRHNRTLALLSITTDNTPPSLALTTLPPDTLRVQAGRPVAIRLGADEPALLAARWGDEPLPLFSLSPPGAKAPSYVALASVPVQLAAAGEVVTHLSGRDAAGNEAERTASVGIDPATLPRQALDVPPALAPLASGPVAAAEAAQMVSLTSTVRPERLWQRPFQTPVPPGVPRTTGFGDRRDYADGYVTNHAGYDLAVPFGAPIAAPADGIVAFAGPLAQRGNCLILDHGWGVFTVYGHLWHFDVEVGRAVNQGQVIGLVGTTGLSTGPHLHWEVRLRGVPIDPGSWLALSALLDG